MEDNFKALENDINATVDIISFVTEHFIELPIMDQLRYVTEMNNLADNLKPLYAKLKNKCGETFICKL